MKILHFIYDHINNPWVGGGGAVRVYELNRRLGAAGHRVTIFSGKFPKAKNCQEGNVEYVFDGSSVSYIFSTFSYIFSAVCFVIKNSSQYDLIIEDFAPWNPLFSVFFTKKPVILHVNHIEGRNILNRFKVLGLPFFILEKFYFKLFKYATALSEVTKVKINSKILEPVVIMPAGIDSELYDTNIEDKEQGGDYILYVGRLHIENKGLDTLLFAMRDLSITLLIVGGGSDEFKLREMAIKLNLSNIEFLGFVGEKKKIELLRDAKLVVLPSRFEGQGIVALEAAISGAPVIVSDIRELKYVADRGFGVAFKTGDAQDLAGKIKFLLKDETLRKEMGQRGKEYAKDFTWGKIVKRYENFLERIYTINA